MKQEEPSSSKKQWMLNEAIQGYNKPEKGTQDTLDEGPFLEKYNLQGCFSKLFQYWMEVRGLSFHPDFLSWPEFDETSRSKHFEVETRRRFHSFCSKLKRWCWQRL